MVRRFMFSPGNVHKHYRAQGFARVARTQAAGQMPQARQAILVRQDQWRNTRAIRRPSPQGFIVRRAAQQRSVGGEHPTGIGLLPAATKAAWASASGA
jgi:hypothetical protein